jgi:hypothetical protein
MKNRFLYWRPRGVTKPWLPRVFGGVDEHHNRSIAVIVPFLGCLIYFWERDFTRDGPEHLSGCSNGIWEGDFHPGCPICWEIRIDIEWSTTAL